VKPRMLPWRNSHAVHQGLSEHLSKNTFHPKVDHHSIMSFGEYTPYLPLNPGVIIVHCFFWWGIHNVQTNPTIFGIWIKAAMPGDVDQQGLSPVLRHLPSSLNTQGLWEDARSRVYFSVVGEPRSYG
jgi:hypothetical protein